MNYKKQGDELKSRNRIESATLKMKHDFVIKNGFKEQSFGSSFNKQSVTFKTIDENISLRGHLKS